MAKSGLSLKALLQLETRQFEKGLNKVKKQLSNFGNIVKSAFALGSVAAFGKQMVNLSKDFEDSMARVQAITNASTSDFDKMRKAALKMGETTRYTASEAANALENLTRNGMSATQATKALPGVMQLAQANAIGLAEAADIVTNSLDMFGLSVENTDRVNDVLSSTASNAATNITELYEALVNAAPAAKVLGFDIEEVSASIGALAQKGVKGADAGTQLRMSLTKMADPKIIAKMQAMGVAIDEQSMKSEGLLKTIGKLKDANLGLSDLVAIFSQKGSVGMQQLISAYDEFDHMLQVTRNSAGTTARMFEQGVGTTRKELDTLKSMYEGLLLSIGDKTSGVVNRTIKLLQNLITNFKSFGGTMLNVASVVVPLLLRNIMRLGKGAATTFAAMRTGIVGLKAAMGGWVTIIASLVTWVGTALYGAWAKVNQPIKDAKKNMQDVETSTERMKREAGELIEQLGPDTDKTTLAGIIKKLTEMFPDFADEINNAARVAENTKGWDKLKEVLQDIVELQEMSATLEAKKNLHEAQVAWLGNTMYKQGKHPIGHTYSPIPWLVGPGANKSVSQSGSIYKQLQNKLGNTDKGDALIESIFNSIADIIVDVGDDATKGNRIQKLLGDYGVVLSEEAAKAYVQNTRDIVGLTPSSRNIVNEAIESGKEVHSADSTLAVTKINNAIEAFNNLETLLGDKLKKKDVNAISQMADQAKELGNVIAENYKYATDEQKQFYETVSELYKKPKKGGGDYTAETPSDLVKKALTGYTESSEQLNSQLKAGSITQEEYKTKMAELTEKTWQAITAFSNLSELLGKMPQGLQDTAKKVGEDFVNNAAEAAKEKAKEQASKLGEYNITPGAKRDDTFDYMYSDEKEKGQTFSPKQIHAIEDELDIARDKVSDLQKMFNDLQSAIDNGDFNLVKDDALVLLKKIEAELANAKNTATGFEDVLNFAKAEKELAELNEQLRSTTVDSINELGRSFETIGDSLFDIMSIFDEDMKDSELYKSFDAFTKVINGVITIMQTVTSVIEAVGAAKKVLAQITQASATKEIAANAAVATSEGTKAAASAGAAAAGAGSSVASIPYIGPILAVAAIGSVVAAILAAMSRFSNGGVVGGSSPTGDKNIARLNSGEMVLTKAQQGTLFNAISSGNLGGGGDVRFRVRGEDLVACLDNYNGRRKG